MNKASSIGLGLLGGMAVGLAIGMLTAPKSGVETRTMLKEKAEVVREKADEKIGRWRNRVGRMVEGMEPVEAE